MSRSILHVCCFVFVLHAVILPPFVALCSSHPCVESKICLKDVFRTLAIYSIGFILVAAFGCVLHAQSFACCGYRWLSFKHVSLGGFTRRALLAKAIDCFRKVLVVWSSRHVYFVFCLCVDPAASTSLCWTWLCTLHTSFQHVHVSEIGGRQGTKPGPT